MAQFLNKKDPVPQDALLEEIAKENMKDKTFPLTQQYEDNQDTPPLLIYFDRQSLLDSLVELEEQDLFLINHVAEEESNLDDYKRRATLRQNKMKNELDDVKSNIHELEASMRELKDKERVLKEMRDKSSFKRGKAVQNEVNEDDLKVANARAILGQKIFDIHRYLGLSSNQNLMNVTDIDCLEDIEFRAKILIDKVKIVTENKKLDSQVKKIQTEIDTQRKLKKRTQKTEEENEKQEKRRNEATKKSFNEARIPARYQMARSKKVKIREKSDDEKTEDEDVIYFKKYINEIPDVQESNAHQK